MLPLHLYCVFALSIELRICIVFKFSIQNLCSLLNPYRNNSLRYSWEISLVFFRFSDSIQINHEKNLQIYVGVTAANVKSVESDVIVKSTQN